MDELRHMTKEELEALPTGTLFRSEFIDKSEGYDHEQAWVVKAVANVGVVAVPILGYDLPKSLRYFANSSFRVAVIGFDPDSVEHSKPKKLRIYINRKLDITPNKRAAHAVHAALLAFGVHPGVKVVVLDKGPTMIEEMRVSVHDAGHTELEPGTLTAGTDWPHDSEE